MLRYLHSLSAFLFCLLTGSFFLGYVFLKNDIAATWTAQYLYVGQLPLLLTALLYGGLSVYLSLQNEGASSRVLGVIIGAPLIMIFTVFLFIRFS